MTDLSCQAVSLADVEVCLARADLFDEGELLQLRVIAVRLRRGMLLSRRSRDLLSWCAARVRRGEARG